ncbi:MAG: HDOD domain-containing protein [Oscillospiraceae bacterium]|nr:HDOD domain-containing protein [Oscillospiraceae bacterium]
MDPTRQFAEQALAWAGTRNPGPWTDHSRYVAAACENIARRCPGLDPDRAYAYGLLHDIGRHAGVTSERHLLDGYRYCADRGWDKAAQICISHAFMIPDIGTSIGVFDMPPEDKAFMADFVKNAVYDDYDHLVQLCDALALPTGFCLLEKRFIDVALRYGTPPQMVPRWKRILEIKAMFEERMGCCLYDLLPGVIENSLR